MKLRLVPLFSAALGAAALLPAQADAQMPFTSTAPPSPFNRPTGLPPVNQTPRPGSTQVLPGEYPQGLAPVATSSVPINPDYRLVRGDQLSYRVAEDRDNEVHQIIVSDQGDVMLQLGGLRVKAAGKTTPQLQADIKSALEREYYYHATVSLGLDHAVPNASQGKVYVTGEVVNKGSLDLPANGELTLSAAILQLGGFTQDANDSKVVLIRKGGPKGGRKVDVRAVLRGQTEKDVVLQPGDYIRVDQSYLRLNF